MKLFAEKNIELFVNQIHAFFKWKDSAINWKRHDGQTSGVAISMKKLKSYGQSKKHYTRLHTDNVYPVLSSSCQSRY